MLFKKLTSLWRRGVKRTIKLQQKESKKLVKSLLVKPPIKARRRAVTSVATPAVAPSENRRKSPATLPPIRPVTVPSACGKWLTSSCRSQPNLDADAALSRMRYWLYLPTHTARSSLPLVVMLHGCGQTATQFAQSTRMNFLAEKKGFAVLYPQRPATRDPSRCWHWYKKAVQQGGGEVKAIVDIVEEVVKEYALDKSRIYIAGISAGAAMANIVALNYPSLIAAVGIHSGSVFGVANSPVEGYAVMQRGALSLPQRAIRHITAGFDRFPTMPAILIHGRKDTVVRPINLAQLTEQFSELNHLSGTSGESVSVTVTEKPGGPRSGNAYQVSDYYAGKKLLLKVCAISQLEHAWSGGDGAARFSEGKGPDASKLMWNFFAKHKRVLTVSDLRSARSPTNASAIL